HSHATNLDLRAFASGRDGLNHARGPEGAHHDPVADIESRGGGWLRLAEGPPSALPQRGNPLLERRRALSLLAEPAQLAANRVGLPPQLRHEGADLLLCLGHDVPPLLLYGGKPGAHLTLRALGLVSPAGFLGPVGTRPLQLLVDLPNQLVHPP